MRKVLHSPSLTFYLKPFPLSEIFYRTPSSLFYISYFSIPLIVRTKMSKIQKTVKNSNHKDAALDLIHKEHVPALVVLSLELDLHPQYSPPRFKNFQLFVLQSTKVCSKT